LHCFLKPEVRSQPLNWWVLWSLGFLFFPAYGTRKSILGGVWSDIVLICLYDGGVDHKAQPFLSEMGGVGVSPQTGKHGACLRGVHLEIDTILGAWVTEGW